MVEIRRHQAAQAGIQGGHRQPDGAGKGATVGGLCRTRGVGRPEYRRGATFQDLGQVTEPVAAVPRQGQKSPAGHRLATVGGQSPQGAILFGRDFQHVGQPGLQAGVWPPGSSITTTTDRRGRLTGAKPANSAT